MRGALWTPAEDRLVIEHCRTLGLEATAAMLPARNLTGVECRARELGVKGWRFRGPGPTDLIPPKPLTPKQRIAATRAQIEREVRRDRRVFVGVWAAIAILGTFIASEVRAHDDAAWIMANPDFGWCCGPQDCGVAPEGAVIEQEGGMFIPATGQFFPYGDRAEHLSEDGRYWWCRIPSTGQVRCVFRPAAGI